MIETKQRYQRSEEFDWNCFWKRGFGKKSIIRLFKKAETAMRSSDSAAVCRALSLFAAGHQYFPVSLTDGAPLAYGFNTDDIFDGKLRPIIEEYSKLVIGANGNAEDHNLKSHLCYLAGMYPEAEIAAADAINMDPHFAPGYLQLARVQRVFSLPDKVLILLEKAVQLAPDMTDYSYIYGDFLQICLQDKEAVVAFKNVLKQEPNNAQAHYGICWSLRRLGLLDEAVWHGTKAVELEPNSHTFYHLIFSLLTAGHNKAAIKNCHLALKRNPRDPAALAFLSTALYETGAEADARNICDFENLLKIIDIDVPPGYSNLPSFNTALAEASLAAPTRIMDPTQTTNLFLSCSGPFEHFRNTINSGVKAYYQSFPSSYTHPFLNEKMNEWRIDGWATRLKEMGEQEHHFHNHAWLSGVYYVQLPGQIRGGKSDDGNIEFCRFRSYSNASSKTEVVTVRPQEGMMVLFPSYFYHRILPFREDEYRISIAFNFIPY